MSLANKVALVTGASRGIGKCIAASLSDLGVIVIGTATTEQGAANISNGCVLDLSSSDSVSNLMRHIENLNYGMPDILVHNAGLTSDQLLMRMQDNQWDQVLATNLTGVFKLSKACLRHMMKAQWGRIISISSVVAFTGNFGQTNYAASKAGIIGFSKSLALEVAKRNITVNVVAPGFIETDMTYKIPEAQRDALLQRIPMQRMGSVEDIAAAVKFLASEEANYITGETIHVNGGMLMH